MRAGICLALVCWATSLAAQQPDSAKADSARLLPEITVTVTRTPEPLSKIPAAVSVVPKEAVRRGQATLGLDESLSNLPGVYVTNRYNYSLDQRLSIRGFGSRANFGMRGVKVLLDGIPQTLPDGQSQLSNLDLGDIGKVEVLRGSSSALYGNASGGVLSFTTEPPGPGPFSETVRGEGGSFGMMKVSSRTGGRSGSASGTLSLSHTEYDGFRQHSSSHFTQLNLGADYIFGSSTSGTLRFGYADAPQAENPGALTQTEYLANPDSAAAGNLLRDADKDVSQGQLGFSLKHYGERSEWTATVFGLLRDLANPLATPPPSGPGPNVGTFVNIDRQALGARFSTIRRLGANENSARLTLGVDAQFLRDDRTNARSVGGVPDTLILDQREKVAEVGPFAQLHWNFSPSLSGSAGVRYDAVSFDVEDHHLSDGVDNSGSRTMGSWSGNAGLTFAASTEFVTYVNVATSFETPTTTELVNQPNSTGGFNTDLDPQRAVTLELGERGRIGAFNYSVAGFLGRISDAIVQYAEVSGRGYFTNAGKVHNDGIEVGVDVAPVATLRLFGSYTWSHYRFADYKIVNGTAVDTLDGKTLPGVPEAFIRLGVRAGPYKGFYLDLDHSMASSIFADDQNTLYVNGWGKAGPNVVDGVGLGVTNLRVTWEGRAGAWALSPFAAVNNLWDRRYVGSLTINGAGGRVFEPAPGRNAYLGMEIGWARD
ncbi:MAG TPA: TonB-dependent receptor [Gemmatimonadales bacterium]